MHGNAEKHLLHRFQRYILTAPYHIAVYQKLQTGIVEQVVSVLLHVASYLRISSFE